VPKDVYVPNQDDIRS